MARNRYLLREFEKNVRSQGYLYEIQGARSIRPSVLDSVLTWERLRQAKPGVTGLACRKMYDMMSVGVGFKRGSKTLPQIGEEEEVTMATLIERGGLLVNPEKLWFDALDKMSLYDVAYIRATRRRKENLLMPPRIKLSTIHGQKGSEADEVVILTDMAIRTQLEANRFPDDEQRVWYVGVTRARKTLHIIAPRTNRFFQI